MIEVSSNIAEISKNLCIAGIEISQREDFLAFSEKDADLLQKLHIKSQKYDQDFSDRFYEHVLIFPELRSITVDPVSLSRLRGIQSNYFQELSVGKHSFDYVKNRLRDCLIHWDAQLKQKWYLGAYSKYLRDFLLLIWRVYPDDEQRCIDTYQSLLKLISFDMDLAIDTYIHQDNHAVVSLEECLRGIMEDIPSGVTELFQRGEIAHLLGDINRYAFLTTPLHGRILYVEYSCSQRDVTITSLKQHGLVVDAFSSVTDAWIHFLANDYDVILIEMVIEEAIDVLNFINQIRRQSGLKGDIPILAITAFDDAPRHIELFNLGVTDCITKPVIDEELFARIHSQMSKMSLIKQVREIEQSTVKCESIKSKLAEPELFRLEADDLWFNTLNSAPDGVIVCDNTHQIILVNEQIEKMFGYLKEELFGQLIAILIPEQSRSVHTQHQQNYFQQPIIRKMGQGLNIDARRKNGELFPVEIALSPHDYQGRTIVTAVVRDVSERKEHENLLKRHQRALSVLSSGNRTLLRSVDGNEQQLLQAMCKVAIKEGGYKLACIAYKVDDDQSSVRIVAYDGFSQDYLKQAYITWGDNEPENTPIALAIQTGEIQIDKSIAGNTAISLCSDIAIRYGCKACISLPLKNKGQTLGALTIYADIDAFDEEEVAILEEMAADLAFGIVTIRSNIAREEAENNLKNAYAMLESTLESTADGIVVTSLSAGILKYNNRFAKIWNLPPANEKFEHCDKLLSHVCSQVADETDFIHRTHSMYDNPLIPFEDEFLLKDGRVIHRIGYPHFMEGEVVGRVCSLRDVTEQKNHELQLIYLANHDALTGLANRNLLNDRLTQAIAYAARLKQQIALLFFDLDRFKLINDSLGHNIGDQVLLEISKRITSCLREEDTVARMGGDEFVVVLPNFKYEEDVAKLARKLLNLIATPCMIENQALVTEASIGIALYPRDGSDINALLKYADTAMYRAKDHGGNNFIFYEEKIDAQVNRHLEIAGQLKMAINRNELQIYYQPQFDLEKGQITGAEALLRWKHPVLGSVSPAEFIPIAEESSIMLKIGEWVLETVITQYMAWHAMGLPLMRIAINISAKQFEHSNLPLILSTLIKRHALNSIDYALELELTEGMLMKHPEQVIDVLKELKAMNFSISIDDFGTGYSSLAYLKRFPIDKLKIDRAFVKDTPDDLDDVAIASAIIMMAHELGMKVIAEGVETKEQLALLKSRGCDAVQGYLTGRPMNTTQFEALFKS